MGTANYTQTALHEEHQSIDISLHNNIYCRHKIKTKYRQWIQNPISSLSQMHIHIFICDNWTLEFIEGSNNDIQSSLQIISQKTCHLRER